MMNYNPFSSNAMISTAFRRYPRNLRLFDRVVGRPGSMGILDYLLVVPFLFKLLLNLVAEARRRVIRSVPLNVLYGIIAAFTVPLAIIKLVLCLAISPFLLIGWGIKVAIQKEKMRLQTTGDTIELNKLMVKKVGWETQPAKSLGKYNPLHDMDAGRYAIKRDENDNLVLVRHDYKGIENAKPIAIIEKTRENMILLRGILGEFPENRIGYFMSHGLKQIIHYDAISLIRKIEKQQALSHVRMMHHLLVNWNVAPFNANGRDARHLIFQHVVGGEALDPTFGLDNKVTFFNTFTSEQRQEAVAEFRREKQELAEQQVRRDFGQ